MTEQVMGGPRFDLSAPVVQMVYDLMTELGVEELRLQARWTRQSTVWKDSMDAAEQQGRIDRISDAIAVLDAMVPMRVTSMTARRT